MRVSSSGTKNVGTKVPLASRRSEEHTSELQSRLHLVCRLLLEKKKKNLHLKRRCTHTNKQFAIRFSKTLLRRNSTCIRYGPVPLSTSHLVEYESTHDFV